MVLPPSHTFPGPAKTPFASPQDSGAGFAERGVLRAQPRSKSLSAFFLTGDCLILPNQISDSDQQKAAGTPSFCARGTRSHHSLLLSESACVTLHLQLLSLDALLPCTPAALSSSWKTGALPRGSLPLALDRVHPPALPHFLLPFLPPSLPLLPL